MNENFTHKGEWFLPASKDNRIKGILTYDMEEGSSLELLGNFAHEEFLPNVKDEEIILGITSDSKLITLYRCYVTQAGGGTIVHGQESGMPSTVYSALYILEGVHIDTPEELKFNSIASEIHNLDEWIGISGFTPDEITQESLKKHEFNVHYKLPETLKFDISNDLKGEFRFTISRPGLPIFRKEVNLKQKVQVIIISYLDSPIDKLLEHLFSFQNFLILGLYRKTYPTNITLGGEKFVYDYGGKPRRIPIRLYFPVSIRSDVVKPKSAISMLFAYGHIHKEFPTIIKEWYRKYEILEPAFNLLFEQFYNNDRFTENTFLNLAQAAETFHARLNNHTKMPKSDYAQMKKAIYAGTPKEFHRWLKEQFNFGN
ncbi:MAG TPA: HEPN domain-containing protein, partial [Bacteroidia bacterium]|nr:HEPN domain-containing protein [Bacteroidia bacterium]